MTMPDLQRYPCNPNLIKNVEDTVDFLTPQVFNSVNFSIESYEQERRKSTAKKNKHFRNKNMDI